MALVDVVPPGAKKKRSKLENAALAMDILGSVVGAGTSLAGAFGGGGGGAGDNPGGFSIMGPTVKPPLEMPWASATKKWNNYLEAIKPR